MITKNMFILPQVANHKACFKFYRDIMGFSGINGDENSPSSSLRQGSAKVTLFQQTAINQSRATSSITSAMVFSNIHKKAA